MRISKIKTKVGELCTPVSAELSAVVERMRSGNNKEAAERIATSARLSRLMEEEGSPHYYLTDKDRLPYLIFSATFGKDGLDHPKDFTNLLLLDVNCEKGLSQVAMMRRRVAQVPYTLLAFAGVSGVTLKVVVRCQAPEEQPKHDKESYLAYLTDAQNSAVRLYSALTGCEVFVKEQSLKVGCRMSHDPRRISIGRRSSTDGSSPWWHRHSTSTATMVTRWCRC